MLAYTYTCIASRAHGRNRHRSHTDTPTALKETLRVDDGGGPWSGSRLFRSPLNIVAKVI